MSPEFDEVIECEKCGMFSWWISTVDLKLKCSHCANEVSLDTTLYNE